MSASCEALITGVGVYTPHHPDAGTWIEGPNAEPTAPQGLGLDRRGKRRASPFACALADVATAALTQAGVDVSTVHTVFGSAIGEAHTMIGLLDQMWRQDGPLSPMKFALSVHNAASGIYSIASANQGFATSIAADFDTPAMALFEGLGALHDLGGHTLVACADEAAPPDLVPPGERFELLAAAIALSPLTHERRALAHLRGPFLGTPTTEGFEGLEATARNPQAGLLDLVDAVMRQRWGTLRLDRGEGLGWCVELMPPPTQ